MPGTASYAGTCCYASACSTLHASPGANLCPLPTPASQRSVAGPASCTPLYISFWMPMAGPSVSAAHSWFKPCSGHNKIPHADPSKQMQSLAY